MKSSEFIQLIMRSKGLSQKELARKLSTTQATISRLVSDKYKISAHLRYKIVNELKYSFEYVFKEVD